MAPISMERATKALMMIGNSDEVFEKASARAQAGNLEAAVGILLGLREQLEDIRGDEPNDNPMLAGLEGVRVKCCLLIASLLIEISKTRQADRQALLHGAHDHWALVHSSPYWEETPRAVEDMRHSSVPEAQSASEAMGQLYNALMMMNNNLTRFFSQFER